MKYSHRVMRRMGLILGLLGGIAAMQGCSDVYKCTGLYCYERISDKLTGMKGDDLYEILGPTLTEKGVNFAVYAKHAERVEVLIFKDPESAVPTKRIPMTKDEESGIWTVFVYGIGVGTHYGYIAFGPNWTYDKNFEPGSTIGFKTDCDEEGNRYNPNKLLLDPYARRIHRDFDWGSGNPASGTARDISDWKAAAKSVVIKSEYVWSDHEKQWRENRMKGDAFEGHAQNDLIFYEVHPQGFTMKALDDNIPGTSGIKNPGTWRGIGEMAGYLKDLGITAVELMPSAEKPDDGTYWGYNTIAFFAPEQRFATKVNQEKTNGVHDEFKEMVDKLHQAGIEVILDIVYNHTGEGGFWESKVAKNTFDYGAQSTFIDPTAATIYSFRGLDNKEYYHLEPDKSSGKRNQGYLDETGVGNQCRTNNKPFRRLILDNLRFWVEEMHVDGFRFDLASILGLDDAKVDDQGDHSDNVYWAQNIANTVIQDIIDDDVMAKYHTRFIAEPWSLSQYVNGLFPKSSKHENHGWFEWNGRYRDMIRPLVNDDGYNLSATETVSPYWSHDMNIGNLLTGSSVFFGDDGRKPFHSVNFLTAHDGFTLYDLSSYWEKHNGCGKLNPICCYDRYNAFCDLVSGEATNHSRNWCVSMSVCGDDCNYCDGGGVMDACLTGSGMCPNADDEALKRQMIRNFFAFMFTSHGSPMMLGGDEYMRTQYGNNNAYSDSANNEYNWFRWGDWVSTEANVRMHDFVRDMITIRKQYKAFLSPSDYGTELTWWGPDGHSESMWGERAIGMYYKGTGSQPSLFVAYNMEPFEERYFALPDGGEWMILVDTQKHFEQNEERNTWLDGSRKTTDGYSVQPRSIVIFTK
ncbi:MAG: glycosyl hydrolase [Proteobacteria bacterium]|nr:glycosyl hydrolase [Pseudomonadota bacterium]